MKLCDVDEVGVEGLKVEHLVDLVHLRDESGASVEDKEEKVSGAVGRHPQCDIIVCGEIIFTNHAHTVLWHM